MYIETLLPTDVGLQAIKDARLGGVYIRPVGFKLGDYVGPAPTTPKTQLMGHELYSGALAFIELLGKNTVRFTFEFPQDAPEDVTSCTVGEALVLLDDGKVLGHVVFKEPQLKTRTYGIRFSLLMNVEVDIGSVIDVTMAEHTTIPCVPDVIDLPNPRSSILNAISVLGLHTNSDGTQSPGLAYRYGSGGLNWAFSGHDRVWCEAVGARMISPAQFDFADQKYTDGEVFIVQAVSGPGAGAVRRFQQDGGKLYCLDKAMPFITADTFFAVWRNITKSTANTSPSDTGDTTVLPWPENSTNVPDTWVLVRGKDNKPIWVPPSQVLNYGSKGSVSYANSLYTPPGKMSIKALVTTAKTDVVDYTLPEAPLNQGFSIMALQGVTQTHTAYDIKDDILTLSEYVDEDMLLDARVFYLEPSQGHVVKMSTVTMLTDGSTDTIDLPAGVTQPDQIMLLVQRVLNPMTNYTIGDGKLKMTEAPASGRYATAYCMTTEERQGWSTRVSQVQFYTRKATTEFQLHTSPEGKAYVIFNENGLLLHPDSFEILGDKVITRIPIAADREVEISVIENIPANGSSDSNISGVFTHAYMNSEGLVFERHGLTPIVLPMIPPTFREGDGIKITGTWPNLLVTNTLAANSTNKIKTYSVHNRVEKTEEITVIERIAVTSDVVVQCRANFAAQLGPGFTPNGTERMDYAVGLRSKTQKELDYNRSIKGTDSAGFNVSAATTGAIGYSNATMDQAFELIAANHPLGYVEIVCKMRVSNALVSAYGSKLSAAINITVIPN